MTTPDINKEERTPVMSQTPNDIYLQKYGLWALGITKIALWKPAIGSRYKEMEKHEDF